MRSSPHFADPALTTSQITFGLNPLVPILSALLIARKIGPVVILAAVNQRSTAILTQVGTGTVRTWPPLPTRSAMTQCSSRCWRSSTVSPLPPPSGGHNQAEPRSLRNHVCRVDPHRRTPQGVASLDRRLTNSRCARLAFYVLDSPDSGRKVGTQEPAIHSFVG
jgi:hypothetical protein